MKNNSYNTHEVKTICENKLSIDFPNRKSPEFNGWFKHGNKKIARITIPKGRKSIPPKTYKSMSKQLKLNVEQFDDLLDCPLDLDMYLEILRDQGLID